MHFLTYPQHPKARTFISFTLIALMLLSVGVAAAIPKSTTASYVDVLTNGGFEHGFVSQPGCGMVGYGWHCFTNGGGANYGFYDDQWQPVVAEGSHSQLIEINTKGIIDGDPDRYAGLYQTVRVVDWENYQLNLRGMIRTTNPDGDPYRYQVQVGWTAGAHADWQAVTNWQDTGWYTYYDRLEPGAFSDYSTHIMAEDDYITVYVRVWKKWPVFDEEIDINLDAISLTGPSPYHHGWGSGGGENVVIIDGGSGGSGAGYGGGESVVIIDGSGSGYPVHPVAPVHPEVCRTEYIYNGGFEHGFNPVYLGHVGKSWGFFTNGGNAGYGFYDEQWDPVVTSGEHGQLIEINAKGIVDGDNDRYAGIYQHVRGLTPGQTYELRLRGMLRGVGGGDDPNRFEADWGYTYGYDADWTHVNNWQGMDLGELYPRTEPGAMGAYSVKFVAQSHEITLFIRGLEQVGHQWHRAGLQPGRHQPDRLRPAQALSLQQLRRSGLCGPTGASGLSGAAAAADEQLHGGRAAGRFAEHDCRSLRRDDLCIAAGQRHQRSQHDLCGAGADDSGLRCGSSSRRRSRSIRWRSCRRDRGQKTGRTDGLRGQAG